MFPPKRGDCVLNPPEKLELDCGLLKADDDEPLNGGAEKLEEVWENGDADPKLDVDAVLLKDGVELMLDELLLKDGKEAELNDEGAELDEVPN